MTSTYLPGTIFRSYSPSKKEHNTAILLKSGELLDLKNVAGGGCVTHSNYDAWYIARAWMTEGSVVIDTKNAKGVVVGSDTHGFKYIKQSRYGKQEFMWTNWCYEMILECVPHLLTNEDVRIAFNNFVDVCEKYAQNIGGIGSYLFSGERRYRSATLNNKSLEEKLGGFPGWWKPSCSYYTYSIPDKDKPLVEEFKKAYTELLTLIQLDLAGPMQSKLAIVEAEKKIKVLESRMRWAQKKMQQHQDALEGWKRAQERAKKELATLTIK